jgi:phospholipid/cholesterol/gamma-HCH transport system substrate-binding protein
VVGRVAEIGFDPKTYEASVTLSLATRYPFPKDTSASIMTSGLLGEQYIALDAGGDEKMLANGDSLKITQGAVVLENLIGQFLYNKGDSADDKGEAAK